MSLRYFKPKEIKIPMPWGHVAAKVWGNEGGIPILGLHGWMDNAATFDKLAPLMSNKFHFVAMDLPGHGLSSHIGAGLAYNVCDYCTTVIRVAKYLKWETFNLLGHSFGAGYGSYFAAVYPNLIDKMVMLDTIKIISPDDGQSLAPDMMERRIRDLLEVEGKMQVDMNKKFDYQDAIRRWRLAADYNTDGEEGNHSLTVPATEVLLTRAAIRVNDNEVIFRHDPRVKLFPPFTLGDEEAVEFLKSVSCKLLIIKADQGPVLWGPPHIIQKTLEVYKEHCKSFRFEKVEGTHFVHLNDPTKVSDLVNEHFLNA